jgi:hypothetical protein
MKQSIRTFVVAGGLLIAMAAADPAFAQKQGGVFQRAAVPYSLT